VRIKNHKRDKDALGGALLVIGITVAGLDINQQSIYICLFIYVLQDLIIEHKPKL
jgi:hypothetical protein